MNRRVLLGLTLVGLGLAGLFVLNFVALGKVNLDGAVTVANGYLSSIDNSDLVVKEVMEFQQNYYVVYSEKSTGINAFEMLIDKQRGSISPEFGPNMMWNTKYGHGNMMGGFGGRMMGGGSYAGSPQISLDKANEIAQKYLAGSYSGAQVEDVLQFYGYYTVHAMRDGKVFGMFSVNAFSGSVWWHSWHGAYIQSRDLI
jgi:hypothetical protein